MLSDLTAMVREGGFVFFALFARKLILCTELAGVVAVAGWRIHERLGIAPLPGARKGTGRAAVVPAAAGLLLQVLFVAFIRDFSELGEHPCFTTYAASCIVAAGLVAGALGLWTTLRLQERPDFLALGFVAGLVVLGAGALDALSRSWVAPLSRLSRVFGIEGAASAYHGIETLILCSLVVRLGVDMLQGNKPSFGRLASLLGLFAGGQGFLAFRGVSAVYIIVALLVALRLSGWRFYSVESSRLAEVGLSSTPGLKRASSSALPAEPALLALGSPRLGPVFWVSLDPLRRFLAGEEALRRSVVPPA